MSMNVNKIGGSAGGGNPLGDPSLGQHYARLVGFSYIGVHERAAWKGEAKPACGKLLFTFELLDDTVEIDGVTRPRWITKKENAFSTSNSNAVKIYNTLDPTSVHGGAFDKLAAATVPCMVTIGPRKDAKDNIIEGVRIDSITPVAKAPDGTEYQLAAAQNPVIIFDFDEPTAENYATLKPWMMKLVKTANDYPGSDCERVAQAYDVLQAQAAPETAAPAAQPPAAPAAPLAPPVPPVQQAAPPVAPPVAPVAPAPLAPAPVTAAPVAPPGFKYDAATNTFVPDAAAPAAPAPGGAY